MAKAHRRWFAVSAAIYAALWIALAIAPVDRATWALENLFTVLFAVFLVTTRKKLQFSRTSYALIFVFLTLHAIGAHFTYAQVPYPGAPPAGAFGQVTAERNMYDRAVHFSFGLLLAYPAREIVLRVADVRGFWGYSLPAAFVMALSCAFEVAEWGAVAVFGERVGMTYLATQGDPWDPQKDMGLATLGSILTMGGVALLNARIQRDFAREWAESLRVKRPQPLGEDAVRAGRAA
jgi:putative membrane protein